MMLLLDRRQARGWWLRASKLRLLLLTSLGSRHYLARPSLVCRVVQERADVVHKERIEKLGDLLLVREIEGAFEGDP